MLIRNDQSSSRETLNQPLHRNQRLDSSESTDTNNQSTDAKIPDGAKITPLSMTLLYYHCMEFVTSVNISEEVNSAESS